MIQLLVVVALCNKRSVDHGKFLKRFFKRFIRSNVGSFVGKRRPLHFYRMGEYSQVSRTIAKATTTLLDITATPP